MKLIVLYGEENSGKSITLKRVYERLKKENLLETNCFKHYDSDHWHFDYRDVLILDKAKAINEVSSEIKWYDGTNSDDINTAFPDGDDVEGIDVDNLSESEEYVADDNDDDDTDENVENESIDNNTDERGTVNIENKNLLKLEKPDLQKLISNVSNLNTDSLSMVGFAMEGDYGFVHDKKLNKSYTMHNRNLYDHLAELSFCDTIVCACSKVKDTITDPKKKPINCVIKFLKDYSTSRNITFCVIQSNRYGGDWDIKIQKDDIIVDQICRNLFSVSPKQNYKIFGKYIQEIGTAQSLDGFMSILNQKCQNTADCSFFYRGESKDFGKTALHPQLFREPKWIENEHIMLKNFEAKFPLDFPKGTSTFDIIVTADHFALPSRVLDISHSALTGLFMACDSNQSEDGFVYVFKVPKEDVKSWNSDTVVLLSNLARMDFKFPQKKGWLKSVNHLVHTIKDEKPDYYKMYNDYEIKKYKKDLNKIVCVESKMLNSRIINQKGLFFLFGMKGSKANYEQLNFDRNVEIYSIRIRGNCKASILNLLATCGYDRMTMFPDMQNVCQHIKNYFLK